jgi:hypothetical protein
MRTQQIDGDKTNIFCLYMDAEPLNFNDVVQDDN